jgi:hypothetical protein
MCDCACWSASVTRSAMFVGVVACGCGLSASHSPLRLPPHDRRLLRERSGTQGEGEGAVCVRFSRVQGKLTVTTLLDFRTFFDSAARTYLMPRRRPSVTLSHPISPRSRNLNGCGGSLGKSVATCQNGPPNPWFGDRSRRISAIVI